MLVAGSAVLGFVLWELMQPEPPRRPTRADPGAPTAAEKTADAPTAPGRASPPGRPAAGKPPAAALEPPPPPPPPIPVAQAREEFAAYVGELEAIRASGRALETPEWTELYRRGNEALEPLVRGLDSSAPEQAAEVDTAHRTFRELIMALEPRPTRSG